MVTSRTRKVAAWAGALCMVCGLSGLGGCRKSPEFRFSITNEDGAIVAVAIEPADMRGSTMGAVETRGGRTFRGLLVEGEGQRARVLAATRESGEGYDVIVESTLPIPIRATWSRPDGTGWERTEWVEPGSRTLVLGPP